MSKPHERTNTSYDIGKKRVLTSKLDSINLEYRGDIQVTDGTPEVRVYMLYMVIQKRSDYYNFFYHLCITQLQASNMS